MTTLVPSECNQPTGTIVILGGSVFRCNGSDWVEIGSTRLVGTDVEMAEQCTRAIFRLMKLDYP